MSRHTSVWLLSLNWAFFESKATSMASSSLSSTDFSRFAGFFGRMNEAVSAFSISDSCFTSLWASVPTNVSAPGVRLMNMPFITGRSSSSAVANIVLLMPATSVSTSIFSSFFSALSCGTAG